MGLYLPTALQSGFRVQSAAPPSAAGTTITQAAYGPASGATAGGPSTAMLGTVGAGLGAIALLWWLWWTLPR
jgi:hypothetical protein